MSDIPDHAGQADLDDLLRKGSWAHQDAAGAATFSASLIAVASGARRTAPGRLSVSVTLVVQPVQGRSGRLAQLPSIVAGWASRGIDLLVDAGASQSDSPLATLTTRLRVGDLGGADARVEDLWQRLMAPARPDTDWWALLAGQLPEVREPDGRPGPAPGPDAPIVRVPRGNAAVSLALRRAVHVRARTAGILNPMSRAEASVIRTAELDRGAEHLMIAPSYQVASLNGEAAGVVQDRVTPAQLAQRELDRARRSVRLALSAEKERAEAISRQQRNYAAAGKSPEDLRRLLKRPQPPSRESPAALCAAIEKADATFCGGVNETHRALHFAATDHGQDLADANGNDRKTLGKAPPPDEPVDAEVAVQRRLRTLETLPRLSRLFNLVVEAEVELDLADVGLTTGAAGSDTFLSLAARFSDGSGNGAVPVWTRAKLSIPASESGDPQFWPCTQEEIDAHLLKDACGDDFRPAISQRAGIVDLGATDTAEGGHVDPRFDLVTVDAVAGIEAEITQERANAEAMRLRAGGQSDREAPDPAFVTLRSAGLCLVDRWRQEAATKAASRAAHLRQQQLGGTILDADDLELGWRLDVGVKPSRSGRTIWRSLCNRMIDLHDPAQPFGDAGTPCGSWIEAALMKRDEGLSEGERLRKRVRLDGSVISAPLRRGRHQLAPDADKEEILHADDLLAQWEGDPLGIECNRQVQITRPQNDLAIMQVHKPLAGRSVQGLLPPPLRFGQRYRLGARVVYRGGVVQPLDQAAELYRTVLDGSTVLPSDTASVEGRALRRHERIAPVAVAQSRSRIETRRKSPYWLPQGSFAVLRDAEVRAKGRVVLDPSLGTDSERRILTAPGVGLAFATLHGVFDGIGDGDIIRRDGRTRPRDGLADVAYATKPLGGFPILARDGEILSEEIGRIDRSTQSLVLRKAVRGDAIFDIREGGGGDALERPLPYYPDPAARFMVIRAVRVLDRQAFRGRPVIVPLYAAGATFPDALPVVLDIGKRSPPASADKPDERRQDDIISFSEEAGTGFLDAGETFYQAARWPEGKAGPRVPVRRVQVWLQPGDDITLEAWCIPDLDRLTRWFDVVESGALLLTAGEAEVARNPYACLRRLSEQTGCLPLARAAEPRRDGQACGVGGLRLPDPSVIAQWADWLYRAIQQEPVPEVASVQRIQAAYAISRPRFAPAFAPNGPAPPITYVRRRMSTPADRRAFVANPDHAALDRWRPGERDGERWSGHDEENATEVLFAGRVKADLDTSDTLSLVGRFASPETDRLDDERRGFRPGQLALYEQGQLDLTKTGNSTIFGFLVDPDGRVRFPRKPVTLMTLRGLRPEQDRDTHVGLEDVDLVADLKAPAESGDQPSAWRYTFKDGLARRLFLSFVSEGRFASQFRTTTSARISEAEAWQRWNDERIDRLARDLPAIPTSLRADAWTDPSKPLVRRRTSLERAAREPAAARFELWLDATGRPARIQPKTLLPGFVWSREMGQAQRRTIVRVRIKRPWFSSGEDERLGVVIWPPHLFSLAAGTVSRHPPVLSDADLGPGGAYVTRWGSDPIRKGATPDGYLVPQEVFADRDQADVRLVTNVPMPLPSHDPIDPARTMQAGSQPGGAPGTMQVSLLTYEPRFDPVQALWYVDLALDPLDLPEPFMRLGLVRYQEHAPAHLRVSEPTVEWVQLLPARTVTWTYGALRAGERGVPVEIKVSGAASLRSAREEPKAPEDPEQALRDRPILRAAVSRRRRLGSGPHYDEHPVTGTDGKALIATDTKARRSAQGLTWTLRLLLPPDDDPRQAVSGETDYVVYLEEVILMRSAAGTPASPRADEETGPRFAVSFQL